MGLIKRVMASARSLFPSVAYAHAMVPTYPSGSIGFVVMSTETRDLKTPLRVFGKEVEGRKMRYYNERVHAAAFALPQFAESALNSQ
jgi:spermidine synthase